MNLKFFEAAVNLKKISRQGWIDKLSMQNPESVADHSYSMAIMGMVVSDLKHYDFEKMLKMILLHDLAESKIGDYVPGQISKTEKHELENNALNDIVENLPETIRSNYVEIWNEYQEEDSSESKTVHQIDRLEMALQAKMYQKEGRFEEEQIKPFLESARAEITDPVLKELFTKIIEHK